MSDRAMSSVALGRRCLRCGSNIGAAGGCAPCLLAASISPPLEPNLEGKRLGPYELKGVLGHGGMGVVYLARDLRFPDEKHEINVALKILNRSSKPLRSALFRSAPADAASTVVQAGKTPMGRDLAPAALPQRSSAPIIGDTIGFLKDPDGFLLSRARELGPVFKMRFLGEDVACFVGPEAFHFFLDERYFVRGGASPASVTEIMHPQAVPFLDGPARARRKTLLMRVFENDALASYSQIVERVVTRYAQRWAERGAFSWVPEITSMGMTVAAALFIGADPDMDHPETERAFLTAFNGMLSLPLKLPFTPFAKALRERDFLRKRIAQALVDHKTSPKDDTLGRLIAARTADGAQLTDDEIRIEAFHFFGAFVVVVGAIAFEAALVGLDSAVKEKLRAEIHEKLADGPVTYARMRELPYLERVSKEVRRARTVLPVTVFAQAKHDCEFQGIAIPGGMKAVGCIGATLQDASAFPDPRRFDPDRWLPDRAGKAQQDAWVPHGGGVHLDGHRCAGERLAELILKTFAVVVLREYDFELAPGQDLEPTTGKLFATPRGGLDVRFRRLVAEPAPARAASGA